MLTRRHIKQIRLLKQRKERYNTRLFVVEGVKSVKEVLTSKFQIERLFCLEEYAEDFRGNFEKIMVSDRQLQAISNQKNPGGALAVCKMRDDKFDNCSHPDLTLILDGINDPGNLGTIIRLADWFGVQQIVASENTVDFYNPKVIQSAMGSFTRVNMRYTDLELFLKSFAYPVFGAFPKGKNIYQQDFPAKGAIIIGNEANGISKEIERLTTRKITIPQWGDKTTESLNAAVATAIILSELRRTA